MLLVEFSGKEAMPLRSQLPAASDCWLHKLPANLRASASAVVPPSRLPFFHPEEKLKISL